MAARERAVRPRRRDVTGARPAEAERGSGQRLTPKSPRKPEPAIADGITGKELDRAVWTQLRTLSKENAEGVAQHLVMVGRCCSTPTSRARRRTPRPRCAGPGGFRRLGRPSGWSPTGRGTGPRPSRSSGPCDGSPAPRTCCRSWSTPSGHSAGRTGPSSSRPPPRPRTLARDEKVELAIVVSGIRRDQGQLDAAAAGLQLPELDPRRRKAWSARLFYAYAEALLALGDRAGAREWFGYAVDADESLETDAAERVDELDGVEQVDLLGDDEDGDETGARG